MSTAATNRCPRCCRGACDVVRPCSVCGYVVPAMKKSTKPSVKPKPPTNGRAWMVDPPGGLHDSAEDALMWACRYRHGAAVVWVTVTPRGKAEAARAAAPAQVRRG